jgi:hypothetical protein
LASSGSVHPGQKPAIADQSGEGGLSFFVTEFVDQ